MSRLRAWCDAWRALDERDQARVADYVYGQLIAGAVPDRAMVLEALGSGEGLLREYDACRWSLLQELAELSVDPDSMDRDSEVDLWGFDSGGGG